LGYEVSLRPTAQKGLDAIPQRDFQRVARAIAALEEEPRPPRVTKLAERSLWRIRVGQYRIVYAVDDAAQVVTIVRVARRQEDTYRGL